MAIKKPQWSLPKVINWPKTTTLLAAGFLLGNLAFMPMVAWLGKYIPVDFRDTVMTNATLFKDGMLLILGFYFGRNTTRGGEK